MKVSLQMLVVMSAIIMLGAAGASLRAAEPSAVGLWEQVDEKSGKPESWFKITERGGVYENDVMSHTDIPLRRIDHVRFFVGNARQSAYFYRNAFGFEVVAYAGLETHSPIEASYVLRLGKITFVLASPLTGTIESV